MKNQCYSAELRARDVRIGELVRRRRTLLNMSSRELGGKIGVRFQSVCRYENGENPLTAARLHKIAEATQTPIDYFFS